MRGISVRVVAGLVLTAAVPHAAAAQGYGVYEQGACVMGRAGTGVAAPCGDGSSIFFNPAGITSAERQQLSVGGTLIAPRGTFTNDLSGFSTDLKKAVYPVPNLYYVRPLGGGRAAAGIGLFAPYGLTTEWPDTFEGRFLGYRSRIAAIYVQPTAALKLGPKASIGAGLDVSFVKVHLRQRLELSSQIASPPFTTFGNLGIPYGTEFGDVNLQGSGHGIGYHIGLQVEPGHRHYRRRTLPLPPAREDRGRHRRNLADHDRHHPAGQQSDRRRRRRDVAGAARRPARATSSAPAARSPTRAARPTSASRAAGPGPGPSGHAEGAGAVRLPVHQLVGVRPPAARVREAGRARAAGGLSQGVWLPLRRRVCTRAERHHSRRLLHPRRGGSAPKR